MLGSRRGVDPLPQLLARLEVRDILSGQGNGPAGFRITPDTRRTEMQLVAAEASDFDSLARRQRITHLLQHGLDGKLHVAFAEVALLARHEVD